MNDLLGMILNESVDGNVSVESMSDKERCKNSLLEFTRTYLWDNDKEDWSTLCDFHYDIAHRLLIS